MRSFLTIAAVAAGVTSVASRPQFTVPRVLVPVLSLRGGEDAELPMYPALTVSCGLAEHVFVLLPLHSIPIVASVKGCC
jgi:hypothetical protein